MADELPPSVPIPDSSVIPPELLGQLQHSAQWANTFSPSDTNLVQRYRHNQEITDYASALAQQRAAAQANLIQTDKTAQNFYFNSLQLDQQHQEAQLRMQHANEMAPLNIAAKQAQIEAAHAQEKARTNADLLKARHDALQASDTTGLTQHMGEIMDRAAPGSEDYNAGVTRGIMEFPNADKSVQSALLKNAGVQMSPEEFIAQAMKAKAAATAAGYSDARVTSFGGKPVIVEGAAPKTTVEKAPPAALVQAAAKLSELQSRAKKTQEYLDAETQQGQKDLLTTSLSKINADLEKAKIRHDALKEAYGISAPAAAAAEQSASGPKEITSKAEFDALPSGAHYIRNGKTWQKP